MVCNACGQPLEPDSRFCGECGERVEDEVEAPVAATPTGAASAATTAAPAPPMGIAPLLGPPPSRAGVAAADRVPPQGQPMVAPPAAESAMGYPPPAYSHPEPGSATTALVLGILGIAPLPLILSIPAIVIGRRAQGESSVIPGQPGMGKAKAGYICGIVGTVWGALWVLYWSVIIIAFAAGG